MLASLVEVNQAIKAWSFKANYFWLVTFVFAVGVLGGGPLIHRGCAVFPSSLFLIRDINDHHNDIKSPLKWMKDHPRIN